MSLLTIAEAADMLRVSVSTLEREAADGRFAIVRIRGRRLVASAEIERYIAAQTCRSAKRDSGGKSASVLAAVDALSNAFRQAPRKRTRSNSKLLSGAGTSTPLRVVRSAG